MYDDLIAVIMGVYIFATKGSKGWKFEEGTRVKYVFFNVSIVKAEINQALLHGSMVFYSAYVKNQFISIFFLYLVFSVCTPWYYLCLGQNLRVYLFFILGLDSISSPLPF